MTLSLSLAELKRVEELKQIGFGVVFIGMTGNNFDVPFNLCYWRYLRGHTTSSLFPYAEAAWRNAIKVWDETYAKVNEGPSRGRTPSELNILQGFKSQGMTWAQLTEKSQYLTDLMIKSGLSIDIRKATETYISLASEPLPIDAMKSTLECAGYKFHFTARVGWYCEQLGHKNDTGALDTAVKAAWKHALDNGGNEVDMVSVAHAYADPEGVVKRFITAWDYAATVGGKAAWEGVGQPPVGTTLWITPHNTLWGFPEVGTYLCEVLAYRDEFVWLELLSDMGENTYTFTTTRTDKVDVKVWKGNNDA